MKSIYKQFRDSVRKVTRYYVLLVEETKSQRLVGSTNEWVLDNYYMISEQEKVLNVELRSREWRRIGTQRLRQLQGILQGYLRKCHHEMDKTLFFRYVSRLQATEHDYLSYSEVCALVPLMKCILIDELALLCGEMESEKAYHYCVTGKEHADMDRLDAEARRNLMVMNIFNSLKKMTRIQMSEVIDSVSYSEKVLKGEAAAMYDQMYDKTKEDYRARIALMARRKKSNEYELVKQLVARADERGEHVGWQLFPAKRWAARSRWYVAIVAVSTLSLSLFLARCLTSGWLAALVALLLLVPVSQVVIDLFNQLLRKLHKPMGTFRLKFKDGMIPKEYTTMVIMPTLLKSGKRVEELLDQLEVYYLSNINRAGDNVEGDGTGMACGRRLEGIGQNLYYTLVGDAAAYGEQDAPWDSEVVEAGLRKVRELNDKYGAEIFNFVYRRRALSHGEGCWLGYERKRGAIMHFNDLLLGLTSADDCHARFKAETITAWRHRQGMADGHSGVEFVITLDTDTELVLYSAQRLIGAMAHPLNRAKLSADGRKVVGGYGIMQPRVSVDVEVTNKSRYAQLMCGLGGLDVYTTASFELYQDIFNEGTFCGKGIYDLRVFHGVLQGAFPENLILSHDLLEGCHIRCGLINDVELFDDNPSNYIDDAKRQHRWTRGDWQIVQWLGRRVCDASGRKRRNVVNLIGRWKIFDNLRRSVLSVAVLLLVVVAYAAAWGAAEPCFLPAWMVLVALLVLASPIVFFIAAQLTKLPRFGKRYHYYTTLLRGFKVIIYRSWVQFAILPREAWMRSDAIVRSCYRMLVSHRNLLNWVPSDEASKSTKGTLPEYITRFWPNYLAAAAVLLLALLVPHSTVMNVAAALFCVASWCLAPAVMFRLGRRLPAGQQDSLGEKEKAEIRQLASDTWHFFDALMSDQTNYLVPDNYQLGRESKTDYKTSPTNIGYSLTAIVSAAELGFIAHRDAVSRISCVLDTVGRLEKWNGHLFNWYDIRTLNKLPNYFVSTADSGNFVACLYVVKGYLLCRAAEETALLSTVCRLIDQTDFHKLYNPELDVFSIGYDWGMRQLLPYHYNNFASEARLTSFMTIAQGDAPYRHWFCLDKTLVQYHGYKGVASWYGTLFEYFMPFIFLPTFKHTLMDETYSFALRAQQSFIRNTASSSQLPWGISETAYNELDDAQNYKYQAFGVPYLKFQNTTPDRIVVSPYSSLMAIDIDDRAVYLNLQRFRKLGMLDPSGFGLYESYDDEDHVPVRAHYAHHQGMILASLANYLAGSCVRNYFMSEPVMRSMETLLKEKAQVKPYIDLKVTQYKRYQYSKVETESDARDYNGISVVPEIGIISNGLYTVLLNDRGSGFSRFRDIMLNRYRKISSDHYGQYLYVRDMGSDQLWSATYAPLDVQPENYRVSFASDKITYQRVDGSMETKTEIAVFKERSAEVRRYSFTNRSNHDVDLEITTYGEVVLAREAEDVSHRVFNAMKISSEYDAAADALFFSRPGDGETRHYMVHRLWVADQHDASGSVEYETSRIKFLGRGGSLRHADVIESRRTLSQTTGTTLDPVMSMRRRLHIPSGDTVEAYVINAFAKGKEQLVQLLEQCQGKVDVEHVFKTASVYNNMRTSLSLLKGSQMRLYNAIAKYMAQTATLGTQRNALLATNTLSQSGLWRFGISGDLAILLMEIDSVERSGFAKEMLRAFEYFKVHGMRLDLVFINDVKRSSDAATATDNTSPDHPKGHEGLTHFIRTMADTEHLWSTHSDAGRVFVLDGDNITDPERILLRTVARLCFNTSDGLSIEQQLQRLEKANQRYQDKEEYPPLKPQRELRVWSNLDFYNQYGGFDNAGRDYVVTNTNTPMPWVNVIANPRFGCVVSSTMAGFTFAYNAQQFKLSSWSNDMVRDTPGEMLLIDGRRFIPATARHGQGFSAFDADSDNLHVDVRLFVSVSDAEKYYHIRLANKDQQPRTVSLDMVCKLVLGMSEEQTSRYLCSTWDDQSNSLYIRNVYHPIYGSTTVRLTSSEPLTLRSLDYPNRKRLGLQLQLAAGASREVVFAIAVADTDPDHSPFLRKTYTVPMSYAEFDRVRHFWDSQLSHIQVQTPDTSFNYMLNNWYLYQVCSSRLFARAGFYQVGGATGFRDQLQDVMSLLYSDPGYARRQILDHAAHQFAEGDVLHWWHESMHLGARTTFSDDYLWLVFVTHQYVTVTGDVAILAEPIPFCQADQLAPGEAERGMNYRVPDKSLERDQAFEYATLYEHLRRAVNRAMSRRGIHGLPLMGCGDWNDGMSRVGVGGKGESVWVAFFLADLLPKMSELTQTAARTLDAVDLSYCEELASFRSQLIEAIQKHAWDGDDTASRGWFLRAYYDNGDAMGSRNNTECQIDLICQAWSILTDVATPEQKASVFRETDKRLVNREHEIIQLLTPPFQHSKPSPGYIMNYPPGVRENGGQYTHGAMWYIMAQLKEGNNDMAYFLYSLINPIHRTRTLADVLKYKVEPYCIAADIYSNPQHPGRGGWTWYTGSASWAYKTGIENILGFHKQADTLTIDPHVPSDWDSFSLRYRYGSATYTVNYSRTGDAPKAPVTVTLVDDGKEHLINVSGS
ncbi:MAG: hypothetical protein IJU81_06790 [Bacteroidales bacterium]|nr:hypothetical protein [Bacteroidales bacterium]